MVVCVWHLRRSRARRMGRLSTVAGRKGVAGQGAVGNQGAPAAAAWSDGIALARVAMGCTL